MVCCFSLIGLHLFVLTLPPTVGALPDAGEAEALWWGFWPVRYPPVWAVGLGAGGGSSGHALALAAF